MPASTPACTPTASCWERCDGLLLDFVVLRFGFFALFCGMAVGVWAAIPQFLGKCALFSRLGTERESKSNADCRRSNHYNISSGPNPQVRRKLVATRKRMEEILNGAPLTAMEVTAISIHNFR